MKRLFIIASLAILAVGCQKTEIQNEVQTPIGFSTETGKQTRAISDPNYLTSQPFGVFSYGYDKTPAGAYVANTDDQGEPAPVMNNVEINEQDGANSTKVWKATSGISYYWPNDPDNYLNFYAYSPIHTSVASRTLKNHQKLRGELSHTEANGLTLDYTHDNMYIDFMVATPVFRATFADQNGEATDKNPKDVSVPVVFHHEMTQVNFTVKIADQKSYPNVDFEIQSIVLNDIYKEAAYTNTTLTHNPTTNSLPFAVGEWDNYDNADTFTIFPAEACSDDNPNGAPIDANEEAVVLHTDDRTSNSGTAAKLNFSTTPVTMIPQELVNQSFTITYKISGIGVATEEIAKTFKFVSATPTGASVPAWANNAKVTYTLTISLNEITFTPSVAEWSSTEGAYTL